MVILEAKRGAELPKKAQLKKYAKACRKENVKRRVVVALTNATPAYADHVIDRDIGRKLYGVSIAHISWRQILDLVQRARRRLRLHRAGHLGGNV